MRLAMVLAATGVLLSTAACGDGTDTATPTQPAATPTIARTATAGPIATAPAGSATPPPVLTATAGAGATATRLPGVMTGIAGLVTIGPMCPVEREDSPCPDQPYEATVQVLDADGALIAEVRSGASGRFEVEVPPGTYTLHPVAGSTPPTASDQAVEVRQGEVTDVLVQFDSGIR